MNFKAMSIVNDKMSDTPETDDQPVINAINDNGYQVPCVDIEYARKLERERDEAREELRAFNHDKKHLCDSHRDMRGNCMVCSMEETK